MKWNDLPEKEDVLVVKNGKRNTKLLIGYFIGLTVIRGVIWIGFGFITNESTKPALPERPETRGRQNRCYGLIARISHSRRYRITTVGMEMMNAVLDLRYHTLPKELNNVN
jgi:hypothetical protein